MIARSVPVSVPFHGTVPAESVAAAVRTLLGEHPGNGVVRIIVEREVSGPGTELMRSLHRLGFRETAECKCRQRAEIMDRMGCEWCAENLPLIVGWLREEATKRGLPFVDAAGTVLVRRAISNARRRGDGKA